MSWHDYLAPNRRESEIAEELDGHLRMAIAERVAKGQSPDAARREAEHEMGDVRAVRAAVRSVWVSPATGRFGAGSSDSVVPTAVRCGLAGLLVVLLVAAERSIFSTSYNFVTGTLPAIDPNRLSMAVLAVSLVALPALVAISANLANQSLDRRRSKPVRAGGARVRISIPRARVSIPRARVSIQ